MSSSDIAINNSNNNHFHERDDVGSNNGKSINFLNKNKFSLSSSMMSKISKKRELFGVDNKKRNRSNDDDDNDDNIINNKEYIDINNKIDNSSSVNNGVISNMNFKQLKDSNQETMTVGTNDKFDKKIKKQLSSNYYDQLKNFFWPDSGDQIPKKIAGRNIEIVSSIGNTRVFRIRNFLTEHELRHLDLIITQHENKFEASRGYMNGKKGKQIVSTHRTSTFIHLRKLGDKVTSRIEKRAAEISGLPVENIEPLQIVSYKDGQHFGIHHDLGPLHEDGHVEAIKEMRRLVTFFVYLNDLPEGEGETAFPEVNNLKVQPERGTAIFFCNVKSDGTPDPLVVHRACPVNAPQRKFGMNIWICEENMMAHARQGSGLLLDPTKLNVKRKTVLSTLPACKSEKALVVGDIISPKQLMISLHQKKAKSTTSTPIKQGNEPKSKRQKKSNSEDIENE